MGREKSSLPASERVIFLSQTNSSLSRFAIYLSRSHEGCCSPSLSSGHRAHSSPGGQAYIDAASVTHYLGMLQSVGFCFVFFFSPVALTFSDNSKILQVEVHSPSMYKGGIFSQSVQNSHGKGTKRCCAFAFFSEAGATEGGMRSPPCCDCLPTVSKASGQG